MNIITLINVHQYDDFIHGIHRRCYQKFTKAKSLLKRKRSSDGDEGTSHHHLRTESACASPRQILLPVQCGICEKYMIKVKGKKNYATPILTITAEATIKKAATLQHDEKMLTKIMTEDLIAREFRKHDKCYLSYTRTSRETSDKQGEGEDQCYDLFDTDWF